MSRRKSRRRRPPVGARPGTLVVEEASAISARLFLYDAEGVEERSLRRPDELKGLLGGGRTIWLDICGLGDAEFLEKLGRILSIHPLALEDVVHVHQRPKAEEYDENILLISRVHEGAGGGSPDQISMIVGPGSLVTFHEGEAPCLDPVLARLRDGKGPMRSSGASYLAYAVLDAVVDGWFPVAEELGDGIADLEARILSRPQPAQLERLNKLKGTVLGLRRSAWAQRDALNRMMRDMDGFSEGKILVYLRDTHDHCNQIIESCDAQRELINALLNMYLSVVSNRMNEVMKVLTIMASIFIPLTFFAGIYGMNFAWMPELQVRWAYPVLLVVMGLTAGGMLIYFRRRGWIGSRSGDRDDDG